MIQEAEFNDWLAHPITRELKRLLHEKREALKTDWEEGRLTFETCEGTAMKSVNAIGKLEAYADIMELEYEDFLTEEELRVMQDKKRKEAPDEE